LPFRTSRYSSHFVYNAFLIPPLLILGSIPSLMNRENARHLLHKTSAFQGYPALSHMVYGIALYVNVCPRKPFLVSPWFVITEGFLSPRKLFCPQFFNPPPSWTMLPLLAPAPVLMHLKLCKSVRLIFKVGPSFPSVQQVCHTRPTRGASLEIRSCSLHKVEYRDPYPPRHG